MRKLAAILTGSGFLMSATNLLAQSAVPVNIRPPKQGVDTATTVGTILSNALTIIFIIAGLAVLFMLIWGAFQWITSGGEKEKIESARKRITHALIGLALLALAFVIVTVVGQILDINILNLNNLPTLESCPDANHPFDPKSGECL